MVTLGFADGASPCAALVVDDQLVSVVPALEAQPSLPWQAGRAALATAGLAPDDVDLVAIAGRFTPPLSARKRPNVRERRADPFSALRITGAIAEGALRSTGMGALDADRATEWFEGQLGANGYRPRQVRLVDVHRCLADAAYRCQPRDEALVVVVHPRGDGAFATAHAGSGGQLDRVSLDRGATGVNLWLDRCFAAAGLSGGWELDAAGAQPDPALVRALSATLRLSDDASRWAAPRIALRSASPWVDLQRAGPGAACAIGAHLRELTAQWIAAVHGRFGGANLVLAGRCASDPRLAARLSQLPGIAQVWCGPLAGGEALAAGAAMSVAGVSPRLVTEPLGPDVPAAEIDQLGLEVHPWAAHDLADRLVAGEPVARFVGRDPLTAHGSGVRSVVVRADDRQAVRRVVDALGRDPTELTVLAVDDPSDAALPVSGAIAGLGRTLGAVVNAPETLGGPHARLGPAADPGLARALALLRARTGCPAVAVVPLAVGRGRAPSTLAEAVSAWKRASLPWLQLGPVAASSEGST